MHLLMTDLEFELYGRGASPIIAMNVVLPYCATKASPEKQYTVETELKVTQSALDVHMGCTPFVKD